MSDGIGRVVARGSVPTPTRNDGAATLYLSRSPPLPHPRSSTFMPCAAAAAAAAVVSTPGSLRVPAA